MSDNQESQNFCTGPVVTVKVGTDNVTYTVHRNLICDASPFFEAGFMGSTSFKESSEQAISLPEDDTDIFDILTANIARWLYDRHLDRKHTIEKWTKCWDNLARLDVFADKYDIVDLRDAIIDAIFKLKDGAECHGLLKAISLIYGNSISSSSFRKLLTGFFAWHIDDAWYQKDKSHAELLKTPEFTADLAVALGIRLGKGGKSPFSQPPNSFYYTKTESKAGTVGKENKTAIVTTRGDLNATVTRSQLKRKRTD